MKLTFVGTSHGIPEPDRNCSCCKIEIGDSIYFIDAGAPISEELVKNGRSEFDKVRAIFTTHAHGDHTLGLIPFVTLSSWALKTVSVDIFITEEGIAESIKGALSGVHVNLRSEGVRFKLVDEGVVFEDENIKVTAIPTKHCLPYPSYAFLVEAEGKRVLFSGDISYHMRGDDMPKEAFGEPVDAFILELAHNEMVHLRPYLEKMTVRSLYFNHINPVRIPAVVEAKEDFAFPITLLNDGDVIEF